jgi:hypothetical protein
VRESRSHGTVRGAVSNGPPYREQRNYSAGKIGLFCCKTPMHNGGMKYGYARVSSALLSLGMYFKISASA